MKTRPVFFSLCCGSLLLLLLCLYNITTSSDKGIVSEPAVVSLQGTAVANHTTGLNVPMTPKNFDINIMARNNNIIVNATTSSSISSHLKARFPKYFIIGFAKTGTKALYETLKLHPTLVGPKKEERFFTDHYKDGIQKYLESIPHPSLGSYAIEKSPDYITSPFAPQRLKDAAISLGISPSHLKFVIVFRNPVARSVSDSIELSIYAKKVGKKSPPPFNEQVIENGTVNDGLTYINHSCYAYHTKNWLKYFNKSQVCFVDGDKFVTSPHSVITLLEKCMELESFFTDNNFIFNPKKGFYCLRRGPSSRAACLGRAKGRPHPQVPHNVLLKVRNHFKSCNNQFYSIIGNNLHWDTSNTY